MGSLRQTQFSSSQFCHGLHLYFVVPITLMSRLTLSIHLCFVLPRFPLPGGTVVPATAVPLGEQPPALAAHFCNVPTTVFVILMSLYPAATCHEGPLSIRTGGGRSWQVLLYHLQILSSDVLLVSPLDLSKPPQSCTSL